MFLVGKPKRAVKSWLLLNLAWDLATGSRVWGIEAKGNLFIPKRPMRVIYFTQEDTEDDVHDRYDVLRTQRELPKDNLWIVPKDLTINLAGGINELQKHIEQAAPVDLIILDPMRRFHYGDENDSSTMQGIWKCLDNIQKVYSCGIIFAHHTIKAPGDKTFYDELSPDVARGSGDLFGGADTFVMVKPVKYEGDERVVTLGFDTKRSRSFPQVTLGVNLATGVVHQMDSKEVTEETPFKTKLKGIGK